MDTNTNGPDPVNSLDLFHKEGTHATHHIDTQTLPHTIHITQHTDIPHTTNTTDTSYGTQIDLPYISHIIQKHHKYHKYYTSCTTRHIIQIITDISHISQIHHTHIDTNSIHIT